MHYITIPLTRSAAYAFIGFKDHNITSNYLEIHNGDIIIKAVSLYFDMSMKQIKSKNRSEQFVRARHICMYIMMEHCRYALKKAAQYFDIHHSSVIHAVKSIRDKMSIDSTYVSQVESLIKTLHWTYE